MKVRLGIVMLVILGAVPAAGRAGGDPIGYGGHGAIFSAAGEQITSVTPEFIGGALQHYASRALAAASPSQRAEFAAKRRFIAELMGTDRQARQMAETLLLDWLIEQAQPADSALLTQRNAMLKSALQRHSAGPVEDFQRAMLAQAGLQAVVPAAAGGLPAPAFELAQKREAYLKRCKAAGVPIPPDWGKNGAGEWVDNKELTRTFIIPGNKAAVFVYGSTTPPGVCLALPRYKAGATTDIEQLGIICMGRPAGPGAVSSACFWDNQVNKLTVKVGRAVVIPIANFAAGEELKDGAGQVCTMCHAGDNAFIVHPDQAPFQGLPSLQPSSYYTPLVHVDWPQNKTPNTKISAPVPAGQKSCETCHEKDGRGGRLPEIEKEIKGYCGAVLLPAIRLTMPTGPGPKPDDKYKQHIKILVDECAKANAP